MEVMNKISHYEREQWSLQKTRVHCLCLYAIAIQKLRQKQELLLSQSFPMSSTWEVKLTQYLNPVPMDIINYWCTIRTTSLIFVHTSFEWRMIQQRFRIQYLIINYINTEFVIYVIVRIIVALMTSFLQNKFIIFKSKKIIFVYS